MNEKRAANNHSVIQLFSYSVIRKSRQAFTLVELLVVVGIIATLIAASAGAYSSMTKAAEKARAQELVNNVATALTALYQQEGNWPKRLATNGQTDGELDENAALALAKGKFLSLSTTGSGSDMKLSGLDRFGIVSPWAQDLIKRKGSEASPSSVVANGKTIKDHLLHYALDLDGDGIIRGASVGGASVDIRATAAVWCCGKDGEMVAYPYAGGKGRGKVDDVYSWTPGQTKDVN